VLLKPHGAPPDGVQRAINRVFGGFFRLFNNLFERGSTTYSRGVTKVTARRGVMIVGFTVLLGCTYLMFKSRAQRFHTLAGQGTVGVIRQPARCLRRWIALRRSVGKCCRRPSLRPG
jgi:multidrug efflux pump subunit AcrB